MPANPRFLQLVAEAKSHVREVTPEEARRQQAAGALLVDVREADEVAQGRAAGATAISRGKLELKIEEVAPDPAKPILCYCGGGSRSALAAENLQRMGYTNVASVIGGFKGWREAGLPTE